MSIDLVIYVAKKRRNEMQYTNDPIDDLVSDIKGTTGVLAKVIFAGFNLVFLVILGIILVSNFTL
jgi:hypothetical protein